MKGSAGNFVYGSGRGYSHHLPGVEKAQVFIMSTDSKWLYIVWHFLHGIERRVTGILRCPVVLLIRSQLFSGAGAPVVIPSVLPKYALFQGPAGFHPSVF